MALTPADVHNVAFSRPRIGKRGYSEQEVDLFIDLVEQELIRHIGEDAQLRDLNAKLRDRDGGLQQREAELADREAELADREAKLAGWEAALRRHVRKHEAQLAQHKAELAQHKVEVAQREAKLARRPTPLAQEVALLRHRESQVARREAQLKHLQAQHAQREAELGRREAELVQWETELRHQAAELRWRVDQQQAVAACVGAEPATNDVSRSYGHPQQLKGALSKPAAVNGTSRLEEMRTVPAVHGRHDVERMAIRAVTDTLGNTVTETVHERTRRSPIDNGRRGVASEHAPELEQLKEENAELTRSLGLLKAAAALLASALDRP